MHLSSKTCGVTGSGGHKTVAISGKVVPRITLQLETKLEPKKCQK